MMGSVVVLEDPSPFMVPGQFVHPAYSTEWRCMQNDLLRLLKETDAPVLWVTDWMQDLARIEAEYDDARLQQVQDKQNVWYIKFLQHLRNSLFCQIKTQFSRPSS